MSVQNIPNVESTLKEVWRDEEVTKQFDEGTLLTDVVEHGGQGANQMVRMMGEYDGRYVIFPLHTAGNPNSAVGRAEGFQRPVEGGQTHNRARYRGRTLETAIGFSREVLKRASGGEQSVLDHVANEDAKTIGNIRAAMNFYLARDGSGMLTSTAADATTFNNTSKVLTVASTAFLQAGMEIILRDQNSGNTDNNPSSNATTSLPTGWLTTDVATGEPMRITSIDSSTTITVTRYDTSAWTNALTGAHGIENSAFGVYKWDSQGRVPWGLDNFCSDANPSNMGFDATTTVTATDGGGSAIGLLNVPGGLDRTVAANSFWKAIGSAELPVDQGGVALNIIDHIQPLDAAILARDSELAMDENAIIAVSRKAQFYQIVNDLESGKRTDIRRGLVDGKYDYVQYGYITFTFDETVPANQMLFFAPRYLFRMVIEPWNVDDFAGAYTELVGNINRGLGQYRKYLVTQQQLCGSSCRPNCKYTNIGA